MDFLMYFSAFCSVSSSLRQAGCQADWWGKDTGQEDGRKGDKPPCGTWPHQEKHNPMTDQGTAASRSQDGKPVSHTPEAYTTLQTNWILRRKLCTFPHLVYQVWTYFKVTAKPADSACLWSAADMSDALPRLPPIPMTGQEFIPEQRNVAVSLGRSARSTPAEVAAPPCCQPLQDDASSFRLSGPPGLVLLVDLPSLTCRVCG